MRNAKGVFSFSSGTWIKCAWFECDLQGYELYKSVFHEHAREMPCDHPMSQHVNFIFCSERHKQYYRNSHIDMGNLPAGHKSTL
jgi:hypothetical protein